MAEDTSHFLSTPEDKWNESSIAIALDRTGRLLTNEYVQYLIAGLLLFAICYSVYHALRKQEFDVEFGKSEFKDKFNLFSLFFIATAASMLIGIGLIAVYKYLNINDNFGQGSGGIVQATWGSAATIAASLVAIFLAQRAVSLSETTNKLTERQTPEYEDAYIEVKKISEIVSLKRVTTPENGSINSGIDILASGTIEINPKTSTNLNDLDFLQKLTNSSRPVKFYVTTRLLVKQLQKRLIFIKGNRRLNRNSDKSSMSGVFVQLLDSFTRNFFRESASDSDDYDISISHSNILVHKRILAKEIVEHATQVSITCLGLSAIKLESVEVIHLNSIKELSVDAAVVGSKQVNPIIRTPLNRMQSFIPQAGALVYTPFKRSTFDFMLGKGNGGILEISKFSNIKELDAHCASLTQNSKQGNDSYFLTDFQHIPLSTASADLNHPLPTIAEYFRMVSFFLRLKSIYSKLPETNDFIVLRTSSFTNFISDLRAWEPSVGIEIEHASKIFPHLFLDDEKKFPSKIGIKKLAHNIMFPRGAYLASKSQFSYDLYINTIAQYLGDSGKHEGFTKPVYEDIVTFINELLEILVELEGFERVTSRDKSDGHYNPNIFLIEEYDEIFEKFLKLKEKSKNVAAILGFISLHPILCLRIYFQRVISNGNVAATDIGNSDTGETFVGVIDLLEERNVNSISEFIFQRCGSKVVLHS